MHVRLAADFVRCSPGHNFFVSQLLLNRTELLTWPRFSANRNAQSLLGGSEHVMFAAYDEASRDGMQGVLQSAMPENNLCVSKAAEKLICLPPQANVCRRQVL